MPTFEVHDEHGAYQCTVDTRYASDAIYQTARASGLDPMGWTATAEGEPPYTFDAISLSTIEHEASFEARKRAAASPATPRERMILDLLAKQPRMTRAMLDAQPDSELVLMHDYHVKRIREDDTLVFSSVAAEAMPFRAEMRAIHHPPDQQRTIERRARRSTNGPRYRGAVWDPVRCCSMHIGVFETAAERDAAVAAAKTRRAIGLPIHPDDVEGA